MIEKHWEYQYEKTSTPWAICAIASYLPAWHYDEVEFAFEIYSELIPNEASRISLKSQRYDQLGYSFAAHYLTDLLTAIGYAGDETQSANKRQLERFLKSIMD